MSHKNKVKRRMDFLSLKASGYDYQIGLRKINKNNLDNSEIITNFAVNNDLEH